MTEPKGTEGMTATCRTDLARPLPEPLRAQAARRGPKNPFGMVVPTGPVAPGEGGH
jgi:hypothetical protein